MIIGLVRERQEHEDRVGLTPGCAQAYISHGHRVLCEAGSGLTAGFTDAEYAAAGARVVQSAAEVWQNADMVVKVKAPLADEAEFLRPGLILFSYLHLAAAPRTLSLLIKKQVSAVAYETITGRDGGLPCLTPMSEIAGRLAVQVGARYLERPGGRGILLGGASGVMKGHVVILGGGTVGTSACKAAYGLGAYVTVLDRSARRLAHLDDMFGGRIQTLINVPPNLHTMLAQADLIVGAVLEPGHATPKLVTRADLQRMKPGTVIVDVSVDQGGCFETIRPTTRDDPSYIIDGIVHYGVANMSAAVSRTATFALSSATLAYGLALADEGLGALRGDAGFAMGLNTHNGLCTCRGVANACGLDYVPPGDALK